MILSVVSSAGCCPLVEDILFFFCQGNPSGINMTSILNCYANMFIFRYAYRKLVSRDLSKFLVHLMPWFYGDDNLSPVHRDIQDRFNMRTLAQVFASIGMTYTSANKSTELEDFVHIDDIEFLKRKFVDTENNVLAPLEKQVILEIPRWCQSDPTLMVDQMQRFNSALLEISNYNQQEFRDMRNHFARWSMSLKQAGYNINATDLICWETARQICDELYDPGLIS